MGTLEKIRVKNAIEHLEGDAKTWEKLSTDAKSEAKSDKKMIKVMNKLYKVV